MAVGGMRSQAGRCKLQRPACQGHVKMPNLQIVSRLHRAPLSKRVRAHAADVSDKEAQNQEQQQGPPPGMPPERVVPVSIKTVQLDGNLKLFQCYTKDHLRYEAEYGLKRGTTTNSYLLLDGDEGMLVDVPRKEYLDVFCNEIKQEKTTITAIVVSHLNPDVLKTLAKVVTLVRTPKDKPLVVYLSNPAKSVIDSKVGDPGFEALADESKVTFSTVKEDAEITVGRRTLQCIAASTPRYPELLCLYERTTRRLFSSCFFSAHVNPQQGQQGTDGMDKGGWAVYGPDWRFFFDCMFAPVVTQASKAVAKLDLAAATQSGAPLKLLRQLARMLGQDDRDAPRDGTRPLTMVLPRHGPVVRQSVTQLVREYDKWIDTQLQNLQNAKVAVLYASAYGNTATLAQAISRGVTKAGVGVEMVNLEQASLEEAETVLASSQGFCIGAPTLGGHMPTQVSAMLGSILRTEAAKALPCGAYGSFGWSGEAVDILNGRLTDAGFPLAFKPIKVQFRPTAKDIQLCEESGTDLAQTVLKGKRSKQKESSKRATSSPKSEVTDAQQAMGRVVGSLSVVTCKDGDAESAMLASWISQASFDPPGLTVAVKRDRAAEALLVTNNSFNVNILKEGADGAIVKALVKNFAPGEDRFAAVEHRRSDNECVVLEGGVSCLQCKVSQRIDAGDHYIVYGTIEAGEVLDSSGVSAVHHRKAGNTY